MLALTLGRKLVRSIKQGTTTYDALAKEQYTCGETHTYVDHQTRATNYWYVVAMSWKTNNLEPPNVSTTANVRQPLLPDEVVVYVGHTNGSHSHCGGRLFTVKDPHCHERR